MHIPDGFLDAKTAIATGAFSLTGLSAALRHAGRHLRTRKIPLIGLAASFIFVAQMINFPVASGTSGHLLGSTLVAVLLGPSAAIIVMSCVLIVQSLIFADGGILALGANVFNMAIVAPLCGYGIYRGLRVLLRGEQGRLVSIGVASWFATVIAASFCAGELAWSGTVSWKSAFPAMAGVHMFTGLGEATISILIIAAVRSMRPELLNEPAETIVDSGDRATTVLYSILLLIGLLLLVAPHASQMPDGLERIASTLGFSQRQSVDQYISTPLKNYQFPGIHSPAAAMMLAGLMGAIGVFILSYILARLLAPRSVHLAESSTPAKRT